MRIILIKDTSDDHNTAVFLARSMELDRDVMAELRKALASLAECPELGIVAEFSFEVPLAPQLVKPGQLKRNRPVFNYPDRS